MVKLDKMALLFFNSWKNKNDYVSPSIGTPVGTCSLWSVREIEIDGIPKIKT